MNGLKRQIIENEAARESRNLAESKWGGAEQAWEALTLILVYDPEFGRPIPESGKIRTFVWQGARSSDTPTIQVLYEDQDPYLEILDLVYSEAEQYVRYHH